MLAGALAGLLIGAQTTACNDPEPVDEVCADCAASNELAYGCYKDFLGTYKYEGYVCGPQEVANNILLLCIAAHSGSNDVQDIPCSGIAGGGTAGAAESECSGWNPDAAITLVSGVHEITQALVDDILADPYKLANCDDGRIEMDRTEEEWEVTAASSGDFLYELGFRQDDFILKANGSSLGSTARVGVAAESLLEGDTDFTFIVDRSGVSKTITVKIVP